jgi:outer membrane protein TolC
MNAFRTYRSLSLARTDTGLLIGIVVACMVRVCFAESMALQHPREHSLQAYLDYAREHNPEIAAARSYVDAGKRAQSLALSLPNPTFSAGYFISEIETRVGPQTGTIGIAQKLPWPGTLLQRRKKQQLLLGSSRHALHATEASVYARIRDAYTDLYAKGRKIRIHEEITALLLQLYAVLEHRYATGTTSQADLLRLQGEISLLQDRMLRLDSDAHSVKSRLRSLLAAADTLTVPFPDSLPRIRLPDNNDTLLHMIHESNPSVRSTELRSDAASADVGVARQDRFPDITFKSQYMFTAPAPSGMVSAEENGKDPWLVGVSLDIPLWVPFDNARIDEAKARASQWQAKTHQEETALHAHAVSTLHSYRDAHRRVRLYENELIPNARQSLSLVQEAYMNSDATVVEYLDAYRKLLSLKLTVIDTKVSIKRAAHEILRLSGPVSDLRPPSLQKPGARIR